MHACAALSLTKNLDVIDVLLESMSNLSITDSDGNTLLHLVAKAGHVHAVRALLAANLDADSENKYHETPLFKATSGRHLGVIRALLEAGADPDRQDVCGWTILHHAAVAGGPSAFFKEFVSALQEFSADLDQQDNGGDAVA